MVAAWRAVLAAVSGDRDVTSALAAADALAGRSPPPPPGDGGNGGVEASASATSPPSPPHMAALTISDESEPASLAEADTSALASAIEAINAGAFDQAYPVLDRIISTLVASVPPGAPPPPAAAPALVARGTAHALRRDLAAAIDDFTAAISAAPGYCDSWKRRGQARAAVGTMRLRSTTSLKLPASRRPPPTKPTSWPSGRALTVRLWIWRVPRPTWSGRWGRTRPLCARGANSAKRAPGWERWREL